MVMNWNGFSRKRSWPNFKVLSRHLPGGTDETHRNLNQDSRSSGNKARDNAVKENKNKRECDNSAQCIQYDLKSLQK
jgi:hypothetical protein